jgi:hypothetical protein
MFFQDNFIGGAAIQVDVLDGSDLEDADDEKKE